MALWCRDFPFVDVAQSGVPKRVTFVYPYYDNPQFFARQIGWWLTYPQHLLEQISFIVVDDGSPTYPAEDVVKRWGAPPHFRLFRIEQDVRWNWLAARNIGAHHAADGWILLSDIDHVVPQSTADRIIYGVHDTRVVYAFSRKEHTGEAANPHSASFLMTRDLFWQIGGYDETLSGYYGTDGVYRRELAKHAKIHVLRDSLIRHEYQSDSSTERYGRKQPQDAMVGHLVAKRRPGYKAKVLSFPYHEVTREAVTA